VNIIELRRLQHAANMLSYRQFCEALGWEEGDYAKHKYEMFRRLGELSTFSDDTIEKAVAFYEDRAAVRS
jgi:hypothetical protein